MAKNKLAGTHPSYNALNWSKESIERKKKYDKKYHATKERKKYRAELNKANKKAGTYGNGDKRDMSHRKGGGLTKESQSTNRARNGRNGLSSRK